MRSKVRIRQRLNNKLGPIFSYLHKERCFDFSGYRRSTAERLIQKRLSAAKCTSYEEYLSFLSQHPDELDNLLDVLTVNVGKFFRDPLTFEYLSDIVFPAVASKKTAQGDHTLRIWSSGCACGEEPFSVAILLYEKKGDEKPDLDVEIFATDIDEGALIRARRAVYTVESMENIKYSFLKRYFHIAGENSFELIPEIKKMVNFSIYDMFDKKNYAPPESIYGSFDIILCRNLLIYFNLEYQDRIINKLYRSLAEGGFLILGEAETIGKEFKHYFRRVTECCSIYRKIL